MNNSVFASHLQTTHSTDKNVLPPAHTILIEASTMTWTSNGAPLTEDAKTTLFNRVGDDECKSGDRHVDPLLKCLSLIHI